jgi:Dolichyl-phosphate-mannose-protein mannosyltransferase
VQINLKKTVLPAFLSFIGALVALFPSNPENMTLPSRDSGVFLYVGWRILMGDIPYRDVWDHKPPLIYLVDALGLLLSPQSLVGVWLLQFIFLFLTILFLYKSLDESLGTIPAVVGMVILTSGLLTILDQGNVTEEYALIFQTLGFWLVVRAQKKNYPLHITFWIGICGGLAFYFKQTTIGIWIAYALLLLWIRISQKKSPLADLFSLLAGIALLSIVFGLIFASQHALNDYWSEAFLYNFAYIGKHEGIRRLIPVFIKGFLFMSQGAVLYTAILGWLAGVTSILQYRKQLFQNIQPVILLALIDLPLEVGLITISGRSLLHYYLTPLPVMSVLSGSLVYLFCIWLKKIPFLDSSRKGNTISVLTLLVVLFLQGNQIWNYHDYIEREAENSYAPVIDYVIGHTHPGDRVLILGAESVVDFLTRREAPTRYVYQYPLQLLGSRVMFEEYFQQILNNKPVLIIDAPGSSQLDENLYKPLQERSAKVRDGVQYLIQNYQPVATYGEWVIYRLIQTP